MTWVCTNLMLTAGANRFVLKGRDRNGKVTAQTGAIVTRVDPPPEK